MHDPTLVIANLSMAEKLGLNEEEFEMIKTKLGRVPNFTELSIFSVMWSEHCSYKNSIAWLKKLPRNSARMIAKAGEENAGLVDIGDDLACCFKIESHNHPSAIEPYQGAATGVGGINRDIFTMGARPIAQLNSLRFGNIQSEKTKRLLKGVVKGIGDYGNAFGVPTVGGELFFDDSYQTNPLINAFSAGIVRKGMTASATSYGVGNPIFIIGSSTGKDGIHGATFASVEITENSSEKLPSVQVGDPFQEKLLLEATLEVIDKQLHIGIQDMGAAGIVCSTSEMSAKGEHGMIIWLDKVPVRQKNMLPFEILLSESQERMLLVGKKGQENEIFEIFKKWDLNCVRIGEVTDTKRVEYFMNGIKVADIPACELVLGGGAPVYEREFTEPGYYKETLKFNIDNIKVPANLIDVAKFLTAHPNISSKSWVYNQYDSMVGTANLNSCDYSDAALIRIRNTEKSIALSLDCNSRYVQADPEVGGAIAVAESARNITCSGGKPIAITNCLNFGNPYNKEIFWQFSGTIKGMKKACEKFDTPVTGGNVSFYNQSEDGPVLPTPVIGMLGLLENKSLKITIDFKEKDDLIYLLGECRNDINCSEYLYSYHKIKLSPPPYFNLEDEYNLQQFIQNILVRNSKENKSNKYIKSAHDVSDGGLFITLLECALPNKMGFYISTIKNIRKDAFLFGESQSRVIVSISPENQVILENEATKHGIPFCFLGEVIQNKIIIDSENYGTIDEYGKLYDESIGFCMK